MTKRVTIPYFPKGLKYFTPVIFLGGLFTIVKIHPVLGFLVIMIGVIILTTYYVTEINLEKKTYSDHLSMLGIPLQAETGAFKSVDRIVITKGNYAQTVNTRVQSRTMEWSDFTGTLLMDGDKTLDLVTRNEKQVLLRELKAFAEFLQVGVEDRTTHEPYWIDLNKVS